MGVDSGYGYGTSVRTTTRTTTTRSNRAASAALRASAAKKRATTAARTAAVGARAAGISGVKSAVFNNPYVQRNAGWQAAVSRPKSTSSQQGFNIQNNSQQWSLNFGNFPLFSVMKGSIPSQQARTVARYGGTKPVGQVVRDFTGVGYDSQGKFGVDPVGLAMAWTPAKFAKYYNMGRAVRVADDGMEVAAGLIGTGARFGGTVTRRLDQGSQQVTRYAEGAWEAIFDRANAAQYGKDIAKIMAENKLKSVPNNIPSPTRGGREVFKAVEDATPASMYAQRVQNTTRTPAGISYPSGVPAGGWTQSPNLRRFTPSVPEYTRGSAVRTVEGGLTEAQAAARDKIGTYLNEAGILRNLSAGMKSGGEYYFPRIYQPYNFARHGVAGRLDPAMHQSAVIDFLRDRAASRRRLK